MGRAGYAQCPRASFLFKKRKTPRLGNVCAPVAPSDWLRALQVRVAWEEHGDLFLCTPHTFVCVMGGGGGGRQET